MWLGGCLSLLSCAFVSGHGRVLCDFGRWLEGWPRGCPECLMVALPGSSDQWREAAIGTGAELTGPAGANWSLGEAAAPLTAVASLPHLYPGPSRAFSFEGLPLALRRTPEAPQTLQQMMCSDPTHPHVGLSMPWLWSYKLFIPMITFHRHLLCTRACGYRAGLHRPLPSRSWQCRREDVCKGITTIQDVYALMEGAWG